MASLSHTRPLARLWLALLAYSVLFALLQQRLLPSLGLPEGAVLCLSALVASMPALALGLSRTAPAFPREKLRPATPVFLLCVALTGNLAVTAVVPLLETLWRGLGYTAQAAAGGDETLTPLLAVYICLVGPVLEELVYRGVVLPRLRPAGAWTAVVLSAVCFGLMHHDLYQGLAAFWGGLVYGWAALYYGLRLSVVLHILNNSVAVALPLLRELGTPGALATLALVLLPAAVSAAGALRWLVRRRKNPAGPSEPREPLALGSEPLLWALLVFDAVYLITESFSRL